jgi:nitrite reductase/ring-hydroxylating ferredoxin subunit
MRPADMSNEQITGFTGDRDSLARVPHVGTYHRRLPVSIERMYENALDWEHLPYLHSSSFTDIECIEAGDWGWRARSGLRSADGRQEVLLELRLDRALRRWITRTLDGPGAGAEIWTHVFELGARELEINVDFFVPGVSSEDAPVVGSVYQAIYQQLYDEDESMMFERQTQLDAPNKQTTPVLSLGPLAELRARLPLRIELNGRAYHVIERGGELTAFSAQCPHMLGPLPDTVAADGTVRCPWHNYGFNIDSGTCADGHRYRLARPPKISIAPAGDAVTISLDN